MPAEPPTTDEPGETNGPQSPWSFWRSLLAVLVFLDLLALTVYFWRIPTEQFEQWKKILSTMSSWLGTMAAAFGIRYAAKSGTTLRDVLGIRPVQIGILAFTVVVWFFVLPFHTVTLETYTVGDDAATRRPVANAQVFLGVPGDSTLGEGPEAGRTEWWPDSSTAFRTGALDARPYQIVVRAPGFEPSSRRLSFLEVVRPFDERLGIPLTPARGHLRVESEPPGARILLDFDSATVWGTTPAVLEVGAGMHHVTSAPPRTGWRQVTVGAGDTATLTLTGDMRPRPVHRVRIESIPSGARVWVDGEAAPRGRTDLWLDLTEGAHRLRLTHESRGDTTDLLSVGPETGQAKVYFLPPASDPPPSDGRDDG